MGIKEIAYLLLLFLKYLCLNARFVDNMIGLWRKKSFEEYQEVTKKMSVLDWEFSLLSDEIVFLDLAITIDRSKWRIVYKPYIKPMKKFIYLPSYSAHPDYT